MSKEYFNWIKKHHKNTPYIKGRNFEYRCMQKLRKLGFYVVRKFGSKGHEDLVAFRNGLVLMVQCKWSSYGNTKPTQFDLLGLTVLAEQYGALAIFAGVRNRRMYFQVWRWTNRAKAEGKWEDYVLA